MRCRRADVVLTVDAVRFARALFEGIAAVLGGTLVGWDGEPDPGATVRRR